MYASYSSQHFFSEGLTVREKGVSDETWVKVHRRFDKISVDQPRCSTLQNTHKSCNTAKGYWIASLGLAFPPLYPVALSPNTFTHSFASTRLRPQRSRGPRRPTASWPYVHALRQKLSAWLFGSPDGSCSIRLEGASESQITARHCSSPTP